MASLDLPSLPGTLSPWLLLSIYCPLASEDTYPCLPHICVPMLYQKSVPHLHAVKIPFKQEGKILGSQGRWSNHLLPGNKVPVGLKNSFLTHWKWHEKVSRFRRRSVSSSVRTGGWNSKSYDAVLCQWLLLLKPFGHLGVLIPFVIKSSYRGLLYRAAKWGILRKSYRSCDHYKDLGWEGQVIALVWVCGNKACRVAVGTKMKEIDYRVGRGGP